MSKTIGAISTPPEFADLLTDWAIVSKNDHVLDLGVGNGVFAFSAVQKLASLGVPQKQAGLQIYGSEKDPEIFNKFQASLSNQQFDLPHVRNQDFFQYQYPNIDVIVGNPPYVRRRLIDREDIDLIRAVTSLGNSDIQIGEVSNLADLYVYFLLASLPKLKMHGRLATILSDAWLNVNYGRILRKYLLKNFHINHLITLDRGVFSDAQVKTVLLLATKTGRGQIEGEDIVASRVKNGLSIRSVGSQLLLGREKISPDIELRKIPKEKLKSEYSWGTVLKTTMTYERLKSNKHITSIDKLANLRIGLQTLAKDFFVLDDTDLSNKTVEKKFLRPFIPSLASFDSPVIYSSDSPGSYLFFCDEAKSKLVGTKALSYIRKGERKRVSVVGKGGEIIGYHKKERIKRSGRRRWYDVKTGSNKYASEILLPRFIYGEYFPVWNQAKHISGGATIQYILKTSGEIHTNLLLAHLAALTSCISEISFRLNAQVYGGGTSNIRITALKHALILDVKSVSEMQLVVLAHAYRKFLETLDTSEINTIVFDILGLKATQRKALLTLLDDLKTTAEASRKLTSP